MQCYIHTHPQTRALGTKIQRMFVSQRINIFCLIYLPLHRPSKYRYICNHINFTTPYNNVPDYLNQTALLYLYSPTQKQQQTYRGSPLHPHIFPVRHPEQHHGGQESNRGRSYKTADRKATQKVSNGMGSNPWDMLLKNEEVSWMIQIHPRNPRCWVL